MKRMDLDEWGEWRHRRRLGIGLWLGIFFLAWGGFELLKMLGYFPDLNFPFWPILLIFVGLALILKRL